MITNSFSLNSYADDLVLLLPTEQDSIRA
uniref:Uncharacterized protein n=1 Tax=Anguilla anguilla TaxID=7936 RepID=A0A0E9V8K2_ANGAN